MCRVCVIVVGAYMYALWAYTLYMYAVITALHVQSDTDIFIVVGDQRSSYMYYSTIIEGGGGAFKANLCTLSARNCYLYIHILWPNASLKGVCMCGVP